MKRKVAKLRLSPNEEARIIREEHERRRKLRIQQVREQQRHISQHIRREVEQRRQRELERLEKELREDWERQHREKLHTLQRLYQESLQLLGQGHRSAKENEPDLAAIAQKEEENHVKAEERYREALKELKSQRLQDHEKQSRSINARKKALQTEKERSAKVASLPPPLPNPIQSIDSKKPHVVKKSDVSAFAATHYHMPESTVDREADTEQPDAHEGAELEVRRLQDLEKEGERRREEQLEKARLRGKEALRREHLVQDRERLLVELEHMQQTDLLRRRQQVSQMPPQIFQPLYKRQETRDDFQREMEFAFEDMYTGERRVKGDLVVQLVPEPLPAPSTGSQDQELDVTLEDVDAQGTGNARHNAEQETSSRVEPPKPAPRRALKKLLDRIRSQRNQWTDLNGHVPAADSPTAVTDQIPERDTTIDTGSLTSEEKLTPVELPEPAHSPPTLQETPAQSPAADALRPDALANRIQEFEEERKKRDEQLEREKRQQVVLLQELEEQKDKLEQLLLEARQEREELKAAAAQRAPVNQPGAAVHDQEVTSVAPAALTELVPPAGEDDHNRRIKEYQQRLLEQNRIHQRSVEVARQRLEEYQRALRIRHNMTAASLLPAVVPSVLSHPPLHAAPSVHLPAPLQLPAAPACFHSKSQPPVEVPTRESDMLAAPSRLPGSGVSVDAKLLPAESISSTSRNQRPDVTAWLTDNVMERVTEHLTERARPSSEPRPYKLFTTHHSTAIPLQTTSDPVRAVSQSITDGAALVSGNAAVKPAVFPRGSLRTGSMSSREDEDAERQRRELQEVQRRMLEQREAVALQQEEERQRRELQEVQRKQEEERQRRELQEVQRKQEEERQRRELQEVQRRVLEQREAVALQQEEERQRRELQELQRKQEEERQRRELQELQRQMLEQREAVVLQQEEERQRRELQELQRKQEEERQRRELQEVQRRMLEQREAVALQQEEERQRRELQEVQRRMLEQKEAVALQQRQQEEERQRQEVEMEHMRRQKETLQALIHADAQPVPEAAREVLVSENIDQTRLKLLASLLRAIEESNGGTLSHLEDLQEDDAAPSQPPTDGGETDLVSQSDVPAAPAPASVLAAGLLPPPPRAAKPPVTRVRLGAMETMTEQHELSAIQEVETPVDTSQVTGPEESVTLPSHALDWDLQEEDSESSVASDATLRTPSCSSSGQRTAEPSTGSGTSSGGSSRLVWRERLLTGAGTSTESSESDSVLRRISPLSSDSGRGADYSGPAVTSYRSPTESARRPPDSDCLSSTSISTGSYITTDPEQNINADKSSSPLLLRHCAERGRGADLLDVSSPSAQSSCVEDVSAAGRPVLAVEALFNDSSIQNIIDRYTRELNISLSTAGKTTDSEGSCVEEPDSSGSLQSLVRVSERRVEDEDSPARPSLPSDAAGAQRSGLDWDDIVHPVQEQDSFRPLIGQLTDQSSCLAADHRDSAMEQLVGQPSAHSSVIGQLPGPPFSLSLDQGGWDSTLSRMIGRLSHQSGSHWTSGGQDFYAGQLMGQAPSEQSTTWLDESRMRPLVGELDESAGQLSGSSDERTHVYLGVSTEASGPSYPALPPEASSQGASFPDVNPHPQDQTLRDQTSPADLGPERTEDSFHPLLAEVTHNETADPSMTFHLPEHSAPSSPDGQPAGAERRVSTPSEESEASPERLRTEESSGCTEASSDSFSRLITSQHLDSVLAVSPATVPPEGADADGTCISERRGDSVPFSDLRLLSDRILEAAGEKGILEQSEITLVSLTDTTLEDQETTIAEDEGVWEDAHPQGVSEEAQKDQETQASKSTLSLDENQTHSDSVALLEFQWGPSRDLQDVHQQKLRALLQRSARRVEEVKAKGALAKIQPAAREHPKAKEPQPVTCKTKTESEPQLKTNTKSKGGQAELRQTTETSGFMKQKTLQLSPPASVCRVKKVDEVKNCTPDQRRRDIVEMHRRTQRLYEQLEEVKRQKAMRNRQEASAKNRLKAKEFHKKTLQKLRAKQTLQ